VVIMAAALVFVDDAVLGRLPPICIKDGVPTNDWFVARCGVGETGFISDVAAFVLLLVGPLGWLTLLVLAVMRRGRGGDVLTVRLPLSQAA
jgi:hypothetical protein